MLFDLLDIDGSGTLSVGELIDRMKRTGLKVVSVPEMLLQKISEAFSSAGLGPGQAFDVVDANGNGLIDFREMDQAFREMGVSLSGKEMDNFWAYINKTGAKQISKPVF
jgi:Ca2+-binding EF-hand superfamily protein